MKIAHVCPYDVDVAGGVREHITNLAACQRAAGHLVSVFAPASHGGGDIPGLTPVSARVVLVPGAGSVARLSLSPGLLMRMGRVLGNGQFDIVHIHEPLMPMVSLAALARSNSVTIGTIHGYRPSFAPFRWFNAPLRHMMGRLSARIAVSEDARAWIHQYFPGHYHVIPDGVDVARFSDPRLLPFPAFADGRPNVLFVGRLEPRKGLSVLLDAFPHVARATGARLIVAGHYSPAEGLHCRRVAESRGLPDAEFLGPVSPEELPRLYRSADIFCAPSTGFEALGIVLLEAMAAGVPLVTTNIEGYRTVVTDGVEGILVPPGDAGALGAALTSLLFDADRGRLMGERGRARAQQFAWPGVARRILSLYVRCIRQAQSGGTSPESAEGIRISNPSDP